jgi:hypothetical protein
MKSADGAELLAWQVRAAGLPAPEREHRFHPTRLWRLDLAWPDRKLACEVDGAVYAGGRHTRGKGYEEDCVKCAEAILAGWRVLRASTGQVQQGFALQWVERALMSQTETMSHG